MLGLVRRSEGLFTSPPLPIAASSVLVGGAGAAVEGLQVSCNKKVVAHRQHIMYNQKTSTCTTETKPVRARESHLVSWPVELLVQWGAVVRGLAPTAPQHLRGSGGGGAGGGGGGRGSAALAAVATDLRNDGTSCSCCVKQ